MVKIIGQAKEDIENQGAKSNLPKDKISPQMIESIYPAGAFDTNKHNRRINNEYHFDAYSRANMPINNTTKAVREVVRHFFGTDNERINDLLNGVSNIKEQINDRLVATNYQIGLYREGLDKVYVPTVEENLEAKNKAWAEIEKSRNFSDNLGITPGGM